MAYVGPDPSIKMIPSSVALDMAYRKYQTKLSLSSSFDIKESEC